MGWHAEPIKNSLTVNNSLAEYPLSEEQNISKIIKTIQEMPSDFPGALAYVMKLSHVTIEKLAEYSHVSETTIKRYRNKKSESHYSLEIVIALCIGMHLPPWLSIELLERIGIALRGTPRNCVLSYVLYNMYQCTIDDIQRYLIAFGIEPLMIAS